MRIGQMARQYARQLQLQPSRTAGAAAAFAAPASPGLVAAQRANQARLTESAKGYLQAADVRDGLVTVSTGLDRAQELLRKAQQSGLTSEQKQALQTSLTSALDDLDQGVQHQQTTLADTTLANTAYDAKRTTVLAADQLGKGASTTFTSVADLRNLDVKTATADQLTEAGKILTAAKSATTPALSRAGSTVANISARLARIQGTLDALVGSDPQAKLGRQRDSATVAALIGGNARLAPGMLFSGFA